MEFIIKEPLPDKGFPNSYQVNLVTYSGDADGDTTTEIFPFYKDKDEFFLENLIETLEEARKAYPNGRGGSDEYSYRHRVDGFQVWFSDGSEDPDNQEIADFVEKLHETCSPSWPYDPMSDYTVEQSFSSYEVVYYDENLVPHKVDIVL